VKKPHVITCGQGQSGANGSGRGALALDLHGPNQNVNLKIAALSAAMTKNVPSVLVDLVEIATYVYAADQAVTRGTSTDSGENWRRTFEIHVPVRNPELWSKTEVTEALIDVLSFLSDDNYAFAFTKLLNPPAIQLYLEMATNSGDPKIDQVLLFSGGADSLAGAVQTALVEKKNVALISHRSSPKRTKKVDALAAEIAKRAAPQTARHIAIWATKSEKVGREFTQRSRSFLYSSFATTVASMLGLDRIHFFENGVTSMNLPIAEQVVGGRATRTTHPQTIRGFSRLFSLILDRTFTVDTPFLWRTKTEIMRLSKDAGCGDLLPHTVSCSRTVEATKLHTHCGRCSQCIDRRFAALAAGLDDNEDPPEMYKVDLLSGERAPGEDRTMAEAFVQRALLLRDLGDVEFFTRFPEANRVLRHTGLGTDDAARGVLELHRRHGKDVGDVLAAGLKAHAEDFQAARLPDSSLLVLTVPDRYRQARGGGAASAADGPAFVREGDFWRASFGNETLSLKDSKGMRYIALMLQSPGREIRSAELIAVEAGVPYTPAVVTAGDLTDRRSIKDCERRLNELEVEIGAAASPEDALAAKQEAAGVEKHLKSVKGLGGNPRKETDENEQARKAVAAAVTRAMNHISKKKHMPLWRHLKQYVVTGHDCVYRPDPPVTWTIGI
jgi:7-cyano-7-deazaguanine synthase in queuosine biosynthesis